jgi:hypothetical protein
LELDAVTPIEEFPGPFPHLITLLNLKTLSITTCSIDALEVTSKFDCPELVIMQLKFKYLIKDNNLEVFSHIYTFLSMIFSSSIWKYGRLRPLTSLLLSLVPADSGKASGTR